MKHAPRPLMWVAIYIVFATILICLQSSWVPQRVTLSIYDERLEQLNYYNSILYSKIYNHSFNGQFRLVSVRHAVRMVAPSSFNVVSVRTWFDEATDKAQLIFNGRWHNISTLETYTARRYNILTHTDQQVNIRLNTPSQQFYSFDKASINPTTISQTHLHLLLFVLALALQLFILVYAVWPFHQHNHAVWGAGTAAFTTVAIVMWLMTTHPLPTLFLVIHALPAMLVLTVLSIILIVFAPYITAGLLHHVRGTTHFARYWDGYVLMLIYGIIYGLATQYQQVISRGQNQYGFDGAIYFAMTEQLIANQTVTHVAPLVSRIGIPWLVAQLFTTDPLFGWQLITTASSVVCTIMLYAISREIITHPLIRIITVTLFMTHWLAPVRYSWFHPVTLDAPLTALMLVAVWTSMQYAKSWQPRWLILFALNLLIGVTVREVPLLFIGFLGLAESQLIRHPMTALASRAVRRRLLAYACLAIAAVSIYWSIQQSVVPTNNHSALTQAYRQLMYPPTYHSVLLAWFNTSGLLIVWLLVGYKHMGQFALKYKQIAFISMAVFALAFISGTDKDRFLMWMHPFVLLMAAYTFEKNFTLFNTAWGTIIVYVQLIIGRAFWVTPDPGKASYVIDTTIFTHLGDNIFFLELWAHHALDVFHKSMATQQFLWAMVALTSIFCLRAWILRRTPSIPTP